MVLSVKKKLLTLLAVSLAAVILLGGTFAWQSLNQEALNYVRGGANPGGRLHADFNNITEELSAEVKTYNKDVYVENFTSPGNDGVNIFARIRLEEYMSIGESAGPGKTESDPGITSVLDKNIFIPGQASGFRSYWELSWDGGGSTVYMPTFNKNKDSLLADLNGSSELNFENYQRYAVGDTEEGFVIQDRDENIDDELTDPAQLHDLIARGQNSQWFAALRDAITVSSEPATHTARQTLTAQRSMSVAQWLEMVAEAGGYDEVSHGSYWVYDTDGWFYWTAPIAPGTATGLLLDGLNRTTLAIDGGWYYEINVVGQFITADDLGDAAQGTGFYNHEKGASPTMNALQLLDYIGVDTTGRSGVATLAVDQPENTENTEIDDEAALRTALETGGSIALASDITMGQTVYVEQGTVIYMNGHTIQPASNFNGTTLFAVRQGAWLDIDGNGSMQAPENGYVVCVEDDSMLYIWNGAFTGGAGVVQVDSGTAVIVDGTFGLRDNAGGQLLERNSADDASVIIYGGVFYGFDPSNAAGESLLAEGYTVQISTDGERNVYTVAAESAEPPQEPLPETDADDIGDADDAAEDQPAAPDDAIDPSDTAADEPAEPGDSAMQEAAPAADEVSGDTEEN